MTIPYSGIAYIETKAYTETLAPPSIIGAAAPLGTLEPWDSHSATMLVRKIAGKALTRPATSGRPCFASIKQKPIANAAAIPRQPNINNGTLFCPLGAAMLFRFNKTENMTKRRKPINPMIKSPNSCIKDNSTSLREKIANANHTAKAKMVVEISFNFSCFTCWGKYIQTDKNIPFINIDWDHRHTIS